MSKRFELVEPKFAIEITSVFSELMVYFVLAARLAEFGYVVLSTDAVISEEIHPIVVASVERITTEVIVQPDPAYILMTPPQYVVLVWYNRIFELLIAGAEAEAA